MALDPEQTERLIGELFQRIIVLEKKCEEYESETFVRYGDKVQIGYNTRGDKPGFSVLIQGWIDKKSKDVEIKEHE